MQTGINKRTIHKTWKKKERKKLVFNEIYEQLILICSVLAETDKQENCKRNFKEEKKLCNSFKNPNLHWLISPTAEKGNKWKIRQIP